jgi:ubiquinone/menaquinone biosynthesis C-methylase UbiE
MLKRIPESEELMDDAAQAQAYDAAEGPYDNGLGAPLDSYGHLARFKTYFRGELTRTVLDLACGPASKIVALAREFQHASFVAVDGAPAMLKKAEARVKAAGVETRIRLVPAFIPSYDIPLQPYQLVQCHGSLHHFGDVSAFWRTVKKHGTGAGADAYVVDLRRPESEEI